MKGHPIDVECYAGGRADERPRRVIARGRKHVVARLIEATIEESVVSKERSHRYKVLTEEGLVLEVVREGDGKWYLVSERRAGGS